MAAGKVTGTNREVEATVAASFAARTEFIKGLGGSERAVLIRRHPVKPWIPWQKKRLAPIALRSSPRAR